MEATFYTLCCVEDQRKQLETAVNANNFVDKQFVLVSQRRRRANRPSTGLHFPQVGKKCSMSL